MNYQVSCPYCQKSLVDDGSLAGQAVACPSCGGQFVMPGVAAPPMPPYAPPGVGLPAGRVSSGTPARKNRRSKANPGMLAAGLLILLVICCAWLLGSFGSKIGWTIKGSKTGGMTKVEFRHKVDALHELGGWAVHRKWKETDVINAFGPPTWTQTVGEYSYWYWTCKDGTIQMVIFNYDFRQTKDKEIYVTEINDY